MVFTYRKWEEFCSQLACMNVHSIRAIDVLHEKFTAPYLVLKHDVETNVSKALKTARIEHKHGHKGSYYVQAYLMKNSRNIKMLKVIRALGHEVSYHYDVMDSTKGNIDKALAEFEKNKSIFEKYGFPIITVCQHGNPIAERVGYTSNRDFMRNKRVRELYPSICDIMVNFKEAAKTDYKYYSDAGRRFQLIFDPLNNDIVDSEVQNIPYDNLDELLKKANLISENTVISIHPHRWTRFAIVYRFKACVFKIAKGIAKILIKIPGLKKVMSRYYYLAKKI